MIQAPKNVQKHEKYAAQVLFDIALPGVPQQDFAVLLPSLTGIVRQGVNALRSASQRETLRKSTQQEMQFPDRQKYLFRGVITAGLSRSQSV